MKHLLICALALLFAFPLFGQFSVGAAAGGNVAFWKLNISTNDFHLESDPLLNYQVMLPLSYSIAKYWQVRAEFGYHRRSWSFGNFTDENGNSLGGDSHLVYQYLEGGLLTTFNPLRKARPVYFLGGVSMSRLTPYSEMHISKETAQKFGLDGHSKQENDFDEIPRNQWLWNAGIGISKAVGQGKAFIEWRVQRNIFNTSQSDVVRKNLTVVAMNVGYQYDL